jgi:hypothetical protein
MAKPCAERITAISYADGVELKTIERLECLRAPLKSEWETLLRCEPTISVLGHPDALVYLMDDTLDRLIKVARKGALGSGLHRGRLARGSLRSLCACGLNPLIAYYSTGELALRSVAGNKLAEDIDEVLSLFHAMAHDEVKNLCSSCLLAQNPGCNPSGKSKVA